MNTIVQMARVTLMSLRSIPDRLGASLVIVIGMAGVVAVLLAVMAMATSVDSTFKNSGQADRVIVIRKGSGSEILSSLSLPAADLIQRAPGIKRRADGTPLVSAESVVMVTGRKRGERSLVNLVLRGIDAKALDLRPEVKLVQGRMYRSGVQEVIVGEAAQKQFQGMQVGDKIAFRNTDWTIVGVFSSNGSAYESELLADATTVLSAYNRTFYQSVRLQLESDASFEALKAALAADPRLIVDAFKEPEYYARQATKLSNSLGTIVLVVGGIMAIGAFFAAINTMYAAVSGRVVEIATLRAMGFGVSAVVTSVLAEALLLSVAGGVLGVVIALLFLNGATISTLGDSVGVAQIAFGLKVSPDLVAQALGLSCLIGVLGGLFPGIQSGRTPVAAALRGM